MSTPLRIGVLGAGAVGCWVGGHLARSGADVVFVGRERQRSELAGGLELVDLGGASARVPTIVFAADPAALADRDVILVCTKSAQTADSAAALAPHVGPSTTVVSLQNGVRNAERLRAGLPGRTVLAGIVGFNVLSRGGGQYRRATSGTLVIEAGGDPRLAPALRAAGLELLMSSDIAPLQWAKLVMNLNNAISALSGAPTRELLFTVGYRRILARVMDESLAVMRAAGIRPARLGALPVQLFPTILRLPDLLLRLVARAQLRVDPEARSSMWEDLVRGRLTEVDHLNGEIVRLAEAAGVDAPLNRRIVELVHRVEQQGAGSPGWSPEALDRELTKI